MGLCSFVIRRGQRYYFRVRVPRPISMATGRVHVVVSLKTCDLKTAKIYSARMFFSFASICVEMSAMIETAKHSPVTTLDQANRLISAAFNLGRECEVRERQLREDCDRQLREEFDERLRLMVIALYDPARIDDTLFLSISGQIESPGWLPQVQETRLPAGAAFPHNDPGSPSLSDFGGGSVPQGPWREHGGAQLLDQDADTPAAAIAHCTKNPTLEKARAQSWHSYIADFFRDKPNLTAKSRWSYNQAFAFWLDLIGHKAIVEIRRGDLKQFANFLRDRDRVGRNGGKLNHKTITRSLGHIKTFLSWAIAESLLEQDNFSLVVARGRTEEEIEAGDARRAFENEELETLFKSKLFASRGSNEDLAKRWFLVASLMTGARTEELADAPAKLVRLGEVYCLDLRVSGRKTAAAPRLVPVPLEMIQLGFVEWCASRSLSSKYLFEGGGGENSARAWSKWGCDYIDKYVTEDSKIVLYSLRHNYRQLQRAGNLSIELMDKIFGHTTKTVGAAYGRNLSAAEAAKYATEIKSPVSLQHLLSIMT
jgi:site-specific recombinase XerD